MARADKLLLSRKEPLPANAADLLPRKGPHPRSRTGAGWGLEHGSRVTVHGSGSACVVSETLNQIESHFTFIAIMNSLEGSGTNLMSGHSDVTTPS